MPPSKPGVLVICGPTASGKTDVAIRLFRRFRARILSADSMQVYRFMDIGTAKPTGEELQKAPHAGIDILNPDMPFDAAAFAAMGRDFIEANAEEGFITIVAGGTGLYIKALLQGLFRARPADPQKLAQLEKEAADRGAAFLHKRLREVDPEAAERIHPNDGFRVIRALEFFETTGLPISSFQQRHGFSDTPDYAVVKIGLQMDREALYDRINQRVDRMLAEGLEEEVRRLLAMGYSPDLKSMQAIGYRHMVDILAGRLTREEGVRLLKRDTRRYAKRQSTWFNADPDILWLAPDTLETAIPEIRKKLEAQGACAS